MRRCIAAPLKTCTFWMAKRSPKQLPDLAGERCFCMMWIGFLCFFVTCWWFLGPRSPMGAIWQARGQKGGKKVPKVQKNHSLLE